MRQTVQYESESFVPDFSWFVFKPSIPSDVAFTNGSESWGFHRPVLRKISSVFADMLDGDKDLKEISLSEDITTVSMDMIQKFVYSKPKDRKRLFREKIDFIYEVKGAGLDEVNGIYEADRKSYGIIWNKRKDGDKLFELYRLGHWYITEGLDKVKEVYTSTDRDVNMPSLSTWQPTTFSRPPAPQVFCVHEKEATLPFDIADLIGIHTTMSKYNLNIPDLNVFLRYLYSSYWSPDPQNFVALIGDARDKGLDELVRYASEIQIRKFDGNTITQYPKWFQLMVLKSPTHRPDLATIIGLITQKAMQETKSDYSEIIYCVSDSLSKKTENFKATVLDVQLRAAKRRRLNR